MYRNERDRNGTCATDGYTAEKRFSIIAEKRGFAVTPATTHQQFQHIDFILERNGKRLTVDVKSAKRRRRGDDECDYTVTWLELRSVSGRDGWLMAEGLDMIAFEQRYSFLVVNRLSLVDWLLNHSPYSAGVAVSRAGDALYNQYTRKNRRDLLTMVRLADVTRSGVVRWRRWTEDGRVL